MALRGTGRPEGLHYIELESIHSGRGPGWPRRVLHRVDQHALRPAQRADGPQAAFPNPVVNRPSRDAEEFRGVIE
jgi:hypothetical protein